MVDLPVRSVFAVGAALMGLGALYFAVRGLDAEGPRSRGLHVVTALVPTIAFGSYLAMALGVGVAEVPVRGGTLEVHWARYADWLFTTPLLLIALGLLVGADTETVFGAVAADAFMIVTGIAATLSGVRLYRYAWWGVSTVAFLLVLYYVFVALGRRARELGEATRETYGVLRGLVGVTWAGYPVWWLVGTAGVGLVPPPMEVLGFTFLDLVAKVGFGTVLLRSRAVADATDASGSDPSSGVSVD
ncbi:bacteriorhodopsin [Haloplanus pelagicus]|jgi:bacteriorhodopsin|uniref:bacteriorhodopsin n=1 Tax=Haloplanus pelagicus TaxID=2949995 RepID=UPI00203BC024|nr:bacteriorhodopsin [Haloplanus sp. HW8-1]